MTLSDLDPSDGPLLLGIVLYDHIYQRVAQTGRNERWKFAQLKGNKDLRR